MSVPYTEFASWTLNDLAMRESHEDRITFAGNHVSVQYMLPVRSHNETAEQFAVRLRTFRKKLPRHSDLSERLALAFEAIVRSGEKTYAAAHLILQILRSAPLEKQVEYERADIGYAYKPIDCSIGSTRRGHRTQRKKRGRTSEERQAETIRAQACRFIRKHENFEKLFEQRLGAFKTQFCRDTEWYATAEEHYEAWAAEFEQRGEPFDWFTAMPLATTAQLYHEQRKFSQALHYYRSAIRAARRAIMHEDLRAYVLSWMRTEVKLCLHAAEIAAMPVYGGRWLPEEHYV